MFRRKRSAKDFADEIRAHLELEAEELKDEGLTDQEAGRRARVNFGNVTGAQERFHMRGRFEWLDNLARDAKFALRQLIRNPSFTVTAVLVLALGLGASTAIFGIVDAALIKPLPYKDPTRLVSLFETVEGCPLCNVSYQNFRDWQRMAHSFRDLEVWGYARYSIEMAGGTESAEGARVSDGFFRTLGVSPILGRDFHAGEDRPGAPRTVLLSYAAWQKRFGADRTAIGRSIELDGVTYAVIGVLPGNFHFAPRGEAEFWTALNEPSGCDKRRACHGLFGLGRLNDGVAVAAASDEINAIALQLGRQYPDSNRGYGALAQPLSKSILGEIEPVLIALLTASGLLLLIACVNLTGLLLLRSEGRKRELAVREALGASASRLGKQFLAEGLMLVVLGVVPGLSLAYMAMRLLPRLVPAFRMEAMPFLLDLGMNVHVIGFAIGISLAAVVLFAVAPVLRIRRGNLRDDLSGGARGASGSAWKNLGSKLVIVELATSLVLLLGAGLVVKSLYMLLHVEIGFRPDHVSSVLVEVPKSYSTDAQVMALEQILLDRARNLPGAVSAGLTVSKPIRSWDLGTFIVVPGSADPTQRYDVPERAVSAGYFAMLGAKLVRGRAFTEAEDAPGKPGVVIINRTLANQLFPNGNPIGKHVAYSGSHDSMQIVGVVEDIKEGQLDTPNRGVIYVPFNQNSSDSFELLVRSTQAPQAMLPMLLDSIHKLDKGIATSYAVTMPEVIRDSNAAYLHRSTACLIGGFALIALTLSVVGLYGVVAYSVTQRTREIGVRMALGAQRSSIYRLILVQAGWLTGTGLLIGVICSLGASTFVRTLLFGVKIWDVTTVASAIAVLAFASFAASFLPARRAATVNPVNTLRAE